MFYLALVLIIALPGMKISGSPLKQSGLDQTQIIKTQVEFTTVFFRYRLHKHSDYGFWQRNSIVHSGSLVKCRYIHYYHGGTADGVDFEEIAQLRSIKIKMTKVKLEISYPCLKNAS